MPSTLPLSLATWSAPSGKATDDLTSRLRRAIESRELSAGTRLPPSREFARQLGVGRNTVVAAYARLLARGLVQTHGRGGTVVTGDVSERTRAAETLSNPATLKVVQRMGSRAQHDTAPHLDWRLGQACTLALPITTWRKACSEVGRHLPPPGYGDPRGELRLREAIACWLVRERGIRVPERQIIITQGAAQAIALLAELLLRPADVCIVENPGYVRAAELFALQGASVRPVAVDGDGLDVEKAFGRIKPALVHLTAAHHYPLGMTLSGARRQMLLEMARRHGTLVLENEYDHEFISASRNYAPLIASAPERVVLISTFAKALSPSMRLGFIAAPMEIADRLAQNIEAQRRQVSWPAQQVVSWLIESGELNKHLRRVRKHLEGLREMLASHVAGLGGELRALGQQGGQHALLSLNSARASRDLHTRLQELGVRAQRIDEFALAPTPVHGTLMSYGQMSVEHLRHATAVLAHAQRGAVP